MSEAAVNYLPKVREQYESMPYPPVNPADEHTRLAATTYDRLDYLNHCFYDGRATFKGYRILCAGDGTGNASIVLAEQLAALGGEVVALDMSTASQAIAKERAAIRKLTNIHYVNASLLDLPTLELGKFDYISCAGVLHHLSDPDEGLRALISVLKPNGILGIMVYAQIGRTPVYLMQDMLRTLFRNNPPIDKQIAITRTLLDNLPYGNWAHHGNMLQNSDVKLGDAGIFDLFLHSQDRAYTVPQIYDWMERCGAKFEQFVTSDAHQDHIYNPATYIKEPSFVTRIKQLPLRKQQTIAELLCGNICMHTFYATTGTHAAELTPDDESLIPAFGLTSNLQPQHLPAVSASLRTSIGKKTLNHSLPHRVRLKLTPLAATAELLSAINNERSIAQIIDQTAAKFTALSRADIVQQWRTLYEDCRMQQILVLRRPEGARFPTLDELRAQMQSRV